MCIHVWNQNITNKFFDKKTNCIMKNVRETCIKCGKMKEYKVIERDPNTRDLPYFGNHLK